VIDQLSGFRGRVGGGVQYYGPLGLAYNTFDINPKPQLGAGGASITTTQTTINSWSLWLAPSLDYFLVDNFSIGGLFSVDTTFGNAKSQTTTVSAAGTTQGNPVSTDLPAVTSFTLMPRIGYLIRLNDRISFWPRVGVGYFYGANTIILPKDATSTYTQTSSISSLLFQIDIAFIYQITDNVFFRAAPAISFSSGGGGKVTYGNNPPTGISDQSGDGSALQFEITSGFGANFTL